MELNPFTAAGMVGTTIILVAYFANQRDWLSSRDWRFPASNLVGALLILVSFHAGWNLPSVVIEVFWSAISLYGLARSLRRRDPG